MKELFFGKLFVQSLIYIVFIEILSYFSHLYLEFNAIAFAVVVFIFFAISIKNRYWAVLIVVAEMLIGSKGYLLHLEFIGVPVSIRVAFFVIISSFFILDIIKEKNIKLVGYKIFKPFTLLMIVIIGGGIIGIINKNDFTNIFFDANGYFYLFYMFVFFQYAKKDRFIKDFIQILTASLAVTIVKSLFLMYAFSHKFIIGLPSLYFWVRNSGVGEITSYGGGFYRIFFQSHVFMIIGFLIIFPIFIHALNEYKKSAKKNNFKEARIINLLFFLLVFICSIIIAGFSRSNWLGFILACTLMLACFLFITKIKIIKTLYAAIFLAGIFSLSIAMITAVVKFPYPKPQIYISTGELLEERVSNITTEAGASSRWNLLPPLLEKIKQNPIFGSGFGTTVTYKSSDPRILSSTVDGLYTTYAFEWGYLDIILKVGFFGLFIYFVLIYKIIMQGFCAYKNSVNDFIRKNLIIGLLLAFFSLMVISVFSPYLNHPLGIGYLIILALIFEIMQNKNLSFINAETRDE